MTRDIKSGRPEAQEVREPLVDIFDEEDYLLIEAEMPGIAKQDVRIGAKEDVLTIFAQRDGRKYYKEVLLPRDIPLKTMKVSCKNGILEIKCPKLRSVL